MSSANSLNRNSLAMAEYMAAPSMTPAASASPGCIGMNVTVACTAAPAAMLSAREGRRSRICARKPRCISLPV